MVEVVDRAQVELEQEAVLAGDAVAVDDCRRRLRAVLIGDPAVHRER